MKFRVNLSTNNVVIKCYSCIKEECKVTRSEDVARKVLLSLEASLKQKKHKIGINLTPVTEPTD